VKAVNDISPVSGEITAVNEALEDTPELVNKDPYGEGWLFKLKLENPDELEELMNAEEYEEYLKGITEE
jgi:glycine cleavage system H protein